MARCFVTFLINSCYDDDLFEKTLMILLLLDMLYIENAMRLVLGSWS